ncbi:type II toxin-antitoxin system Phd/YefM family antitoxin [Aquincola sp. S2]|uniref:Type II toxin-antitoxin system Phd/YefM family antitoxin n=1 Tax=Pseudaquabacterium terrae TaxID=2732868 RepID=A0ABX2EEY6_9BURK|nr:type II toxin-antitoxin system Phd/YefM family antitoxin [Aquabacterium terrae]NRF67161.1 type II toxin-antitoxin system Phd/YefM family antitoxin [Aquabacterium terrae]
MTTELRALNDLPRQNATQVKNRWGEVVRLVRQSGSVAITHHANVEMVLVPAAVYEQVARELQTLKAQQQSQLEELAQRFEARLAGLQHAAAPQQLDALLAARGKLTRRPKAGATF